MTADVTAENLRAYETPRGVSEYTREEGLRPNEAALVARHFPPPPAAVLDLGCGAGRTTVGLAALGYEPLGIDLAEALLAAARERFPKLAFRRMDATRLELPDASFDAALFSYNGIDCIHPVAARVACLRETFRVLRPGGVFLLSSHNALGAVFSGGFFYLRGHWNALRFAWEQRGNALLRDGYFRYPDGDGVQHLYSALPSRTEAQLRSAGFEVVAVRGTTGRSDPRTVRWHERHVDFVARKP